MIQEQFIDKACRWLVEHSHNSDTQDGITCTPVMTEGTLTEDFRKAMTEKTNPLFEQCITNVNPETREDVRRNMDAALVWHKVSEELPDEEKEVIVIYDNGYLCYNHRPKIGGYYRTPDGEKVPYEPLVDEDGWCDYSEGSTRGHKVVMWTDNPMED